MVVEGTERYCRGKGTCLTTADHGSISGTADVPLQCAKKPIAKQKQSKKL